MISFPNNIRFRFRDDDRDSQVILSTKDFDKMVKGVSKQTKVSKKIATNVLLQVFYNEIKRTYGVPSKVTVILDETTIVVH
jgi:hypothetical protein